MLQRAQRVVRPASALRVLSVGHRPARAQKAEGMTLKGKRAVVLLVRTLRGPQCGSREESRHFSKRGGSGHVMSLRRKLRADGAFCRLRKKTRGREEGRESVRLAAISAACRGSGDGCFLGKNESDDGSQQDRRSARAVMSGLLAPILMSHRRFPGIRRRLWGVRS